MICEWHNINIKTINAKQFRIQYSEKGRSCLVAGAAAAQARDIKIRNVLFIAQMFFFNSGRHCQNLCTQYTMYNIHCTANSASWKTYIVDWWIWQCIQKFTHTCRPHFLISMRNMAMKSVKKKNISNINTVDSTADIPSFVCLSSAFSK